MASDKTKKYKRDNDQLLRPIQELIEDKKNLLEVIKVGLNSELVADGEAFRVQMTQGDIEGAEKLLAQLISREVARG
ncbi:MAG: hypothetical protein JWQ09_1825 [Segetibacter sp.]|nr:hypothetical protein [Segetibacter sp.]